MSATLILIIITVIISITGWNNPQLQAKWMLNPYMVQHKKQYYRFITSGFIHANWMHLIFNMFVFFMFGEQVEGIFVSIFGGLGVVLYLFMYMAAIIVSDIPTFLKNREDVYYNALGASGGTSAILFCFILFDPMQSLCLYGLLCFKGFIWGGLYIMYSVYMSKKQIGNINHDAHLWGGLFGVAFTILVYPKAIMYFLEQVSNFSIF